MRRIAAVLSVAAIFVGGMSVTSTAASRMCGGIAATIVGTDRADILRGTPGGDVIVARGGADVVIGRGGNDFICGNKGRDTLVGGGGNDALYGGPNSEDYLPGGDDFLFGGPGNDFLNGGSSPGDRLFGGPGDDEMKGPGHQTRVSYVFAAAAVTVDLAAGSASGEGADVLTGIEDVDGSRFDDVISGDDGLNNIAGGAGEDSIAGGGDNDYIDGGAGADTMDGGAADEFGDTLTFESSGFPVTAFLYNGTATGDGGDSFSSFENLEGSHHDDSLSGDDGPNYIDGLFGDDTLFGRGGDDFLSRGTADGGEGTDQCEGGGNDCESTLITDPASLPFISEPQQGAVLDSVDSIQGGIAGGITQPPDEIAVAVRSMTARGCRWWDVRAGSLKTRSCASPLLNRFAHPQSGNWTLDLYGSLPPGSYDAFASGNTYPYTTFARPACFGYFEPDCVSFTVQ